MRVFLCGEIGRQLVKAPLAAAISPYLISPTPPNPTHPTQPMQKIDHHTGDYVPYSFSSFFNVPQIIRKCCETGPPVLSSLSEKTRKSDHL